MELSGAKTKLSYVECLECRGRFKGITPNHLNRHGLTVEQYRQRHPTAILFSDEQRDLRRRAGQNRRLRRICRKCGKPFVTGSPKAHYCVECQRLRYVLSTRKKTLRYHRRRRNSAGEPYKRGTFDVKYYLEIVDGRVRGAVLLEKHVSINGRGFYGRGSPFKGLPPVEYEAIYLITIYLIIWKGKIFCGECGSQLTVARENEHYTIPAEVCCRSCGLVYELDKYGR